MDLYDNTPGEDVEALYVNSLIFGGSTLNLNGTELYINGVLLDPDNLPTEFVGHIVDQPLAPVPPGLLLFGSGILALAGWRRFRKGINAVNNPV